MTRKKRVSKSDPIKKGRKKYTRRTPITTKQRKPVAVTVPLHNVPNFVYLETTVVKISKGTLFKLVLKDRLHECELDNKLFGVQEGLSLTEKRIEYKKFADFYIASLKANFVI
jgi:hypothetical protein